MKKALVFLITFLALAIFIGLLFLIKSNKQLITMDKEEKTIRLPAVAGQFYPADKEQIQLQLDKYFQAAGEASADPPQILLVPHAGWEYSGAVAGQAFAQIQSADFDRVILLGSAHRVATDKIVLENSDFWQTPLGQIAVDQTTVQQIVDASPEIIIDCFIHRNDHVLEVELPFLQKALGDFRLVPILIGQINEKARRDLASILVTILKQSDKTLLVISSDLSHYPDSETAAVVDKKTVDAILSGREEQFIQVLDQLKQNYSDIDTFACGADAIRIALRLGETIGWRDKKKLALTNSGETAGQSDRVVGYGALAFWLDINNSNSYAEELTEKEKQALISWSRQVLTVFVKTGQVADQATVPLSLEKKRGVFVTLKKDGRLRGCIGNFHPQQNLWQEVKEMTVSAASRDNRFPPVEASELNDINIEISVLSPMKKITSLDEIKLSRHGVYIKYGARSGTFLPQVAEEGQWTKESFLAEICSQKMGLDRHCYQDSEAEIYIYTAQIFSE